MSFIAVYDACALHDPAIRDLLVRLAQKRALNMRAKWTEQILDEMVESIIQRRPDLNRSQLKRTRQLMCEAVPDCLVTGWEPLVEGLDLPDYNDRHVLAAAIRAQAQVIVTSNLKDFPADKLQPFDIETKDPDEFVLTLINLHPASVAAAVTEQAADLRRPAQSCTRMLEVLAERGLTRSASELEELLS